MSRLKVDDTILQKELKEAQAALVRHSDTWPEYEALGRVLHWMGDPSAKEYLREASKIRLRTLKADSQRGSVFLTIGNYFRLAGEPEVANNYFLRAYEMLKRKVGDINNPEEINFNPMQFLIMVCFLLRRYEETIMYGNIFREDNPSPNLKLLAHRFTELAEAKVTSDMIKAERSIDMIAAGIRSARGKIQSTGIITSWDAYELGLEVLADIEASNQ